MVLGKVMGSVWATHKEAGMDQLKLLLIQPLDFEGRAQGSTMIAADRIGAGIGEHVIVSRGNPARMLFDGRNVPIDAIVVGIVDGIELGDVKLSFDTEGGEEHD